MLFKCHIYDTKTEQNRPQVSRCEPAQQILQSSHEYCSSIIEGERTPYKFPMAVNQFEKMAKYFSDFWDFYFKFRKNEKNNTQVLRCEPAQQIWRQSHECCSSIGGKRTQYKFPMAMN